MRTLEINAQIKGKVFQETLQTFYLHQYLSMTRLQSASNKKWVQNIMVHKYD